MWGSFLRSSLVRVWDAVERHLPIPSHLQYVGQVADLESRLTALADTDLRRDSLALRYRALTGEPLVQLLPEAFGLMREAARRAMQMRHYDSQIAGGLAMHFGAIAEMQTGEGKTLAATLPLYLAALSGNGAHLATANDYLSGRDASIVRPAFDLLGLTVASIDAASSRSERRRAYRCDVTYAAAREFGFDFLRDRLLSGRDADRRSDLFGRMLGQPDESSAAKVQRDLQFCLVDEADSILIDEARTPLIVSALPGDSHESARALFRWAAAVTSQFQAPEDFEHDRRDRKVTLSAAGRRKVRELPQPAEVGVVGLIDLYEHIERALLVEREYLLDRHYVVRDGKVVIVDEFTGRLAEGRMWRDGIHQAVQAKDGLEISLQAGDAARITVQDFFRRYQRLAGMTGTASTSAREFKRIYKLAVRVIPTHRACCRQQLPDFVCGNADAKWRAVVAEVASMHAAGRPVLIGTRSIDKSEHLSQLLTDAGIEHQVLNAHRHAEEAQIVAQAGERGKVTVATNMAGRGTDIRLGSGVQGIGGMHVVCTELHDSARIDRQLIGRCARQGDPGSFRQFMSLDDDILRAGLGEPKANHLQQRGQEMEQAPLSYRRLLRRAQKRVERQHFRQRRLLLYHDQERRSLQQQMGQDPYLDAGA